MTDWDHVDAVIEIHKLWLAIGSPRKTSFIVLKKNDKKIEGFVPVFLNQSLKQIPTGMLLDAIKKLLDGPRKPRPKQKKRHK